MQYWMAIINLDTGRALTDNISFSLKYLIKSIWQNDSSTEDEVQLTLLV